MGDVAGGDLGPLCLVSVPTPPLALCVDGATLHSQEDRREITLGSGTDEVRELGVLN